MLAAEYILDTFTSLRSSSKDQPCNIFFFFFLTYPGINK